MYLKENERRRGGDFEPSEYGARFEATKMQNNVKLSVGLTFLIFLTRSILRTGSQGSGPVLCNTADEGKEKLAAGSDSNDVLFCHRGVVMI